MLQGYEKKEGIWRILEHIIQTIDNKKLIEKAISKMLDLTQLLTEASQTEDIDVRHGKWTLTEFIR